MTLPPEPVTLDEVGQLHTWEEALAFAQRGIDEIRTLKAAQPELEDTARQSRDALQACLDRRESLRQIMSALLARAPVLE